MRKTILIGLGVFFFVVCTVGIITDAVTDDQPNLQQTSRSTRTPSAEPDKAPFGANYVAHRYRYNMRLLAIEYGCEAQWISTNHITSGEVDINLLEVLGLWLSTDVEIREAIKEDMLKDGYSPREALAKMPGINCPGAN